MPPKKKYTREQIVDAAYELVRTRGEEAFSARNVADALDTSTAPIFTAFANIEELFGAVVERAKETYTNEYIAKGLGEVMPFKGAGRQYIRFAKEEPMLFRMLFMRGAGAVHSHYMPQDDENEAAVRDALCRTHGIDSETAKKIYNHLSVYCHGLATLFAQGSRIFTDEDIDRMLVEIFVAIKEWFLHGGKEEKV